MKNLITTALILTASQSYAQYLPHTFKAGQPAKAAEVNANFNQLNDNATLLESRVETLETANQTVANAYEGFSMPFAPTGSPKNVIVLRRDDTVNDEITYYARVRYENSNSVTINVQGSQRAFQYIAEYCSVVVTSGTVTSVKKYYEAMDDPSYTHYHTNLIDYDPATFDVLSNSSNGQTVIRETEDSPIVNEATERSSYEDNSLIAESAYMLTKSFSLSDTYRVSDTISFDQAARFEGWASSNGRVRIKGIGTVERFSAQQAAQKAIYYSVTDQEGGSLSGTPYAADGEAAGFCF